MRRREVPTPQECGLPEKFEQWRPNQEEGLFFLQHSQKRVKALCSPTGSGKTAVIVADALLSGEPTVFVTPDRGQQDKMVADFGCIGMVDLRGRRNYECSLRPDYTCEDGYAARCVHKGTVNCPASKAEMTAALSRLVVTNYTKWTSSKKFGQGMGHFTRLSMDEGHRSPDALDAAMQVILHHKEIEEGLGMDFLSPREAEDMGRWKVWAAEARAEAQNQFLALQQKLAISSDPKPAWVKEYTHLRYLCRRLAILSTARPADWIVDEIQGKGYQFDPIRSGRYSESSLLMKIPDVTITSATLREKALFLIGIGREHYDFLELQSDFDPKRCPIYYTPTMKVDRAAHDLSRLWFKMDQIAARRTDRKGIVQSISFQRQGEAFEASHYANRMIVNPKGEVPTNMIQMFRMAAPGSILVTPSVAEGYDFPGRDCEWQFISKVPFPPPSKILKAREAADKEYPHYLTMIKLVQICGRNMRSIPDRGENFIGDDHLKWFLPAYGHLAPKSFHARFRRVETLPPPPPAL